MTAADNRPKRPPGKAARQREQRPTTDRRRQEEERAAAKLCQLAEEELRKRAADAEVVEGWFDEILGRRDPRLSETECADLIRQLRIVYNRHQNSLLERQGPQSILNLKDVDPNEEIEKRARAITAAANLVLLKVEEINAYAGGYVWPTGTSTRDVEDILARIGALPIPAEPKEPARGRPITKWHSAAPEFARIIERALRHVGYKKRLGKKDSLSLMTFIGAKAVGHFYDVEIQPKGFVAALERRNRKKRASRS